MIGFSLLAIGDLFDSRILGVLVRSLLVTVLIFLTMAVGLGWALAGSDPCAAFGATGCRFNPAEGGIGAVAITLLAMWFLFPAIALGVVCAYAERIAAIVEQRHYPLAAARARPIGAGSAVALGLRSAARVLIYNLIALPFYVVLLVTGIGPLILFVVVNGTAFGRDLGEMIAARHGDRPERRTWLRGSRGGRMLIGVIVTALFLVPVANLLAPVLGATMAAHLFHRRRILDAG
ncbi:MAG: EI24 domain-containing protein [Pseudomonadota bacterium]